MTGPRPTGDQPVVVAGAGIAGLTAALAFVDAGRPVRILERRVELDETGAGIQLSPNATRILARYGVLDGLAERCARPDAVAIRDARDGRVLAELPLGLAAERRWGAPYLVTARATLHAALLERVHATPLIELETGIAVEDVDLDRAEGLEVHALDGDEDRHIATPLLVGADGVWSTLRGLAGKSGEARNIGRTAWRLTLPDDALGDTLAPNQVTAFCAAGFHLIVYPLGGGVTNLVLIAAGRTGGQAWGVDANAGRVADVLAKAHQRLQRLGNLSGWTAWPIAIASPDTGWTHPAGLALIGDAAHAMEPYAAQGAAMAIEDAATLAALVAPTLDAQNPEATGHALERYTALRRPRIRRVAMRGALNRLAWHAAGPVAMARDRILRWRGGERLTADLDWLYGYDALTAAR